MNKIIKTALDARLLLLLVLLCFLLFAVGIISTLKENETLRGRVTELMEERDQLKEQNDQMLQSNFEMSNNLMKEAAE
jgi:cell division protein FtsL